MNAPVLFIVYNRPTTTQRVFDQIRRARPKNLYISADAPLPDKQKDKLLCEQVKKIVSDVDWPCEVHHLYQIEHLGCKFGVVTAISWFFEQVEAGIILEDDCLPSLSFFSFCSNLLNQYQEDPKVFHITGDNFQKGIQRGTGSYYYSKYAHIWGWATWRRSWKQFNLQLKDWKLFRDSIQYRSLFLSNNEKDFWTKKLNAYFNDPDKADYWSLQWQYTCWFNGGRAITPQKNLVTNIGFGSGTHTIIILDHLIVAAEELIPPYTDPIDQTINDQADDYTYTHTFKYKGTIANKLKYNIYRILKKFTE